MEFTPRDFFEYANIQLEEKKFEQEQNKEFLGELLASIHNNGQYWEGKKAMSRKDFIRLSHDGENDEDQLPDIAEIQEQMRLASEALSTTMNHEN